MQGSGLAAASELWIVDVAVSDVSLGLVIDVTGETANAADAVITTLLVRVERGRSPVPDGIWAQISMGAHTETVRGR